MLDEHAELFRADDELFFTYAMRGHDLLTDDQIDRGRGRSTTPRKTTA